MFKYSQILLLTIPFIFTVADAATLYKWVDEDGNIHYGDSIPPKYAPQGHNVLSDQGFTVENAPRAKTEEEIAAEEAIEKARQEKQAELAKQKELEAQQAESDRRLLNSYGSANSIVKMRDEKISLLDASINLSESRIEKLKEELIQLQKVAARHERSGNPVPENTLDRIKDVASQIEENKEFIQNRRDEQQAITSQFNADLERYKDLLKRKAAENSTAN